jgi:hypothetical protein
MMTLFQFLRVMCLDCELEIFNNNNDLLLRGYRSTIDLPGGLYEAKVIYFVPGIVTKIFIEEPRY